MDHTNISNKPQSKRQQIWRLVSDGSMTPKDIALKVGTSVENVWKEKSLLKSREGLVLSRSTTQKSKKQSEMILFNPEEHGDRSSTAPMQVRSRVSTGLIDYLIDIPHLGSEDLKTLYREFKSGKKPIDILAEYGFHPEAVEIEYRRFRELSERDSDELLRRIMLKVIDRGYEEDPAMKMLIDLYRQRGYLTNTEILEVLTHYRRKEIEQEIDFLGLDVSRRLPSGFRRIKCSNCDNLHIDVIVNDKLPLVNYLLH